MAPTQQAVVWSCYSPGVVARRGHGVDLGRPGLGTPAFCQIWLVRLAGAREAMSVTGAAATVADAPCPTVF